MSAPAAVAWCDVPGGAPLNEFRNLALLPFVAAIRKQAENRGAKQENETGCALADPYRSRRPWIEVETAGSLGKGRIGRRAPDFRGFSSFVHG
jgi:hypothetical protein